MGMVMISIVTGYGPRVGSSFVMNELRKAGIPIMGNKFLPGITIKKHNPTGYWELDPFTIVELSKTDRFNGHVIKLWPQGLSLFEPSRIQCAVILERKDKQEQLKSISKVWEDEKQTEIGSLFSHLTPEDLINNQIKSLESYKFNSALHVYTEDLNNRIGEIIKYLERGY
jgi:hypothetical protein